MNRRHFFRIFGAVAALPAISLAAHDDTAYVQGLLDAGLPVPPGTYRITQVFMRRPGNVIRNCRFAVISEEGGIYADAPRIVIEGNTIVRGTPA